MVYSEGMLSYRHAFHAGNAADVLKHSVLVFCIEYLLQKEKPLLCIDTHAGAGSYALNDGYAARNREWEQGFGKLRDKGNLPPLLHRYISVCAADDACSTDTVATYPGSPLLMARLLRPIDRLVCYELHPADFSLCSSALAECPPAGSMELRQADGFSGLKSLLPPPSRRGLIFIDPPYELKDDYDRVPEALTMALRRFATGTYIVWYPLLREPPAAAENFPQRLLDLYQGNGGNVIAGQPSCRRCRVELYTPCKENSPRGMYGSGLVIFNPPWTLAAALSESLPVLGTLMGTGADGWKVTLE